MFKKITDDNYRHFEHLNILTSEHFLFSNHSDKDMLLIPLEILKSKRDSVKKAREADRKSVV